MISILTSKYLFLFGVICSVLLVYGCTKVKDDPKGMTVALRNKSGKANIDPQFTTFVACKECFAMDSIFRIPVPVDFKLSASGYEATQDGESALKGFRFNSKQNSDVFQIDYKSSQFVQNHFKNPGMFLFNEIKGLRSTHATDVTNIHVEYCRSDFRCISYCFAEESRPTYAFVIRILGPQCIYSITYESVQPLKNEVLDFYNRLISEWYQGITINAITYY